MKVGWDICTSPSWEDCCICPIRYSKSTCHTKFSYSALWSTCPKTYMCRFASLFEHLFPVPIDIFSFFVRGSSGMPEFQCDTKYNPMSWQPYVVLLLTIRCLCTMSRWPYVVLVLATTVHCMWKYIWVNWVLSESSPYSICIHLVEWYRSVNIVKVVLNVYAGLYR